MTEIKVQKQLLALVALNVLLNATELPAWVIISALALLAWRAYYLFKNIKLPGAWLKSVLLGCATVAIYLDYRAVLGTEPSAAFLVLLTALKAFELRSYRDAVVLNLLCYLLLMIKLIFSQDILTSVFMAVDIVLITTVLFAYHSQGRLPGVRLAGKTSLRLALQAMPLILLMFFIFPRFSISWFRPPVLSAGKTGFSEDLNPGEVSQLARSDEIAFRVIFPEEKPRINQLYWRGGVLRQSFGLKWLPYNDNKKLRNIIHNATFQGQGLEQQIFVEGSGNAWLFALDWPQDFLFESGGRKNLVIRKDAWVYRYHQGIHSKSYYRAWSDPSAETVAWDRPIELDMDTDGFRAPRTRELANRWRNEFPTLQGKISKLMNYFQSEFKYSLQSGRIYDMDEFMFVKKVGFCEHFAATAANLLRLMGVPARVVVGFHGGRPSVLDDYFLVRYMDAHAWVEYWHDQLQGWRRLDPTAVVAPQRLTLGAEGFRPFLISEGGFSSDFGDSPWQQSLRRYYLQASLMWDQAEMSWTRFLMRYDESWQRRSWQNLGLGKFRRWLLFLFAVIGGGVLFALIWFFYSHRRGEKLDPLLREYRKLCIKLEKAGLPKKLNEGPIQYEQRAIEKFPQHRDRLSNLFSLYRNGRYQQEHLSDSHLSQFKKALGEIRLGS